MNVKDSNKKDNKKLRFFYDKRRKDFISKYPDNGKWDANLLFSHFLTPRTVKEKSLLQELNNRGYDLSTIKFSINKADSDSPKIDLFFPLQKPELKDYIKEFDYYHYKLRTINDDCIVFVYNARNENSTLSFVKKYNESRNYYVYKLGIFGDDISEQVVLIAYQLLKFLNDNRDNSDDFKNQIYEAIKLLEEEW